MAPHNDYRLVQAVIRVQTLRRVSRRSFQTSAPFRTDGVYKQLTEMRVRTPWIEALRRSRETGSQSAAAASDPPKPDLTPKSMADSHFSFVLPLAQDSWLLDTYANSNGQLRTGALLMDLDALSGVIAYKHTGEGVSTVTAAVDRITIRNPLKEICDLEMGGQVSYATGRSSMEITLYIAKAPEKRGQSVKPEDVFMTCAFTMVSLDPVTKKPVNIAPLKVSTPAERALFSRGEENYKRKKLLRLENIIQKPPDAEESALIHKMWTDSLAYDDVKSSAEQPSNMTPMSKTTIHTTQIMQPINRNRHSWMIFGGYLLKQTFELAFTCAASFSHTRPRFLNLDPSTFEEPVPVGSVLYVSAGVTYTEPDSSGGTRVQIMVRTHVRNVENVERKSTGTFFYTFHLDKDVTVQPQSYSEFMRWVGGRRRAEQLTKSLDADTADGSAQYFSAADGERVTE